MGGGARVAPACRRVPGAAGREGGGRTLAPSAAAKGCTKLQHQASPGPAAPSLPPPGAAGSPPRPRHGDNGDGAKQGPEKNPGGDGTGV